MIGSKLAIRQPRAAALRAGPSGRCGGVVGAVASGAVFAEILTIGDELCRGEIVDTNSSWLAAQLWDRDVTVRWMTSCRDDADDIRRAVTEAAARADVVLCSGGLGPTEDDLTVDVVGALVGAPPVIDEPARLRMEQ